MAHAFPGGQRRAVPVPAPPPLHPIVAPPPPPQPVPAFSFPLPIPVDFPPVTTGCLVREGPIFLHANRPAVVVSRGTAAAGPVLLVREDDMRDLALAQFMAGEGLVPSSEEELKRVTIIEQLREIALACIKKITSQRKFPMELISGATAAILPFGSYGLGVHGPESDIDALCIGPCYATLDEFFDFLGDMLQNRPEVSEIHCVKKARVPLMRFKFNEILVDFPYAQLTAVSVPDNVDLSDTSLLRITSWRSLSGVCANRCILELVPNLKKYQVMLRCAKLWAKIRGIYSHLLGFLGGIHLAILAAYVCTRFPDASISRLISIFFDTFLHWPWPQPVILLDRPTHTLHPDGLSLMPIMMPCSPYGLCSSNITVSTFNKIMAELHRGSSLTRLENIQGFCDPNPTEYVEHGATEPNKVFYWGLSPAGCNLIDAEHVKQEFMKIVNHYDGYEESCCKLELSIMEASQLPNNV